MVEWYMYNTDSRQYIYKQSTGVLWNFFHDEKQGLCYSTLNKRNNWTNPVSLFKNAHRYFFADMDQEDRFHIVFQDIQGNVHYSLMDGDSIKTVPVLNSKTPAAYNKHLYLIPGKSNILIFYILQHDNSLILAYQIISEGKISNPKVIDYITDSNYPCSFICDKASNIYAFYQSSDGKYLQLGYKKYNSSQKFWSEFTPITKYAGNCEYPRTIIDNNGIIHLCYQRKVLKQNEMVYQQKMPDKNLWTNEVIVHSSIHSFENASILWSNDSIIIYWVRDDIIYYNSGSQSGNSWGKPAKYYTPSGRQIACMSYKSNNVYDMEKLVAKDIPGSFSGGLKLIFHQPASDNGENLSAEELRNLIVDSLKLLKTGVEELREADSDSKEEINKLANGFQELEKELVKCTVKLNMIETQINQAKSFSSRLETLSSEIQEIRQQLEDKGGSEVIGDGS
jgi:hypothetical protein